MKHVNKEAGIRVAGEIRKNGFTRVVGFCPRSKDL